MGLVLLYHRVASLESDPQRLAVTPENFAAHLEILRAHCHPMPLRELADAAREGTEPRRAVAVTFDDGYADNFENAKPLLERHGVPATVFVTTSYPGNRREFWWDDLERLLLLPGRLPQTLRLSTGRTVREWNLDGSSTYDAGDCARHADWNVERPEDPTSRHRTYRDLCGWLRAMPANEREAALGDLAGSAQETVDNRATHRTLSPDEVARLTEGGMVDVGAHTETHSRLSALSLAEQEAEITGSRLKLQELTGREVTAFAYPFGGRSDYTRATVAVVRNAGFTLACSARRGRVGRWADRFQLPRELVRNWDPESFSSRLREWLGDGAMGLRT